MQIKIRMKYFFYPTHPFLFHLSVIKKTYPVLLTGALFVDGILKTLPCVEKSTANSTLSDAESAYYLDKKKPHFL